ncbi:MAG: hypothetical protein QM784_38695 [Polyangiaceae bacterium]
MEPAKFDGSNQLLDLRLSSFSAGHAPSVESTGGDFDPFTREWKVFRFHPRRLRFRFPLCRRITARRRLVCTTAAEQRGDDEWCNQRAARFHGTAAYGAVVRLQVGKTKFGSALALGRRG